MRAEDHEFEEIVRARKQEDWLSCITLCREAIQHDAGSDPGRLYRLKLVLAYALLEDSKRSPASCDEAISVLEEVVVCVEPGSERWASVNRNLGFAYSVRMPAPDISTRLDTRL